MFANFYVNLRKNEGFPTCIPCIPIPEYSQSNAPLDRKDANFVSSTLSSLSICSGGTKFGVTAEYPATPTKFCVAGYAVRRN